MGPIAWLFLMVILLIIEILTLGLTTIWFAGGALLAFVAGVIGLGIPIQMGVFVAGSVILLIFTRPVATRYFNGRTEKTNIDGLQGRKAVVVTEVDNRQAKGMVQLDGNSWTARSRKDEDIIPVGENVIVDEVQGVKLIVSRLKEENL